MEQEHNSLAAVKRSLSRGFNVYPLVREMPADTLTPVAAYLRLCGGGSSPRKTVSFLLESVEGGERLARYSFLGVDPFAVAAVAGRQAVVRDDRGRSRLLAGNPFLALGAYLSEYRSEPDPSLPSFTGGAVGGVGYEMIRHLEPTVRLKPPAGPEAELFLFKKVIAFDHIRHRMLLLSNVVSHGGGIQQAYRQACKDLDDLDARLSRSKNEPSMSFAPGKNGEIKFEAALGKTRFVEGVKRLKGNIRAGDIFQAVLSDQFSGAVRTDPFTIYRALRTVNPSPYMFFIGGADAAALGASPEMLVRVENGIVETRPIAGTRPRGKTEDEDRKLERNLLASVKERAEHVMLVDLGRNDVGRVARPGSVEVSSFMQVERYSHVMHLVSSVRGRLRAGFSPWQAFAACFPAGTVTGAPKIRAMQLISGIEPVPRGLYAGAVVYCGFGGNLDSAIAIRSMTVRRENGKRIAQFQAGAGIVADSNPEREHEEIINKSRAIREAIRRAEAA